MKPTEVDIIYLAGLFDGEGWASIRKNQRNPATYHGQIAIKMCERDLLKEMQEKFGGKIYSVKVSDNRKPIWSWVILGPEAIQMGNLILPFMRISRKRNAVKCVLNLMKRIQLDKNTNKLSHVERMGREGLYQKCKFWNRYRFPSTKIEMFEKEIQLFLF